MATSAAVRPDLKPLKLRLVFIAAVILSLLAFRDGLSVQLRRWTYEPEYSHGFFILAVSVWLLWDRRKALSDAWGQPHFGGPALVILAIAMLVVGKLSAVTLFSQIGFLVALAGLFAAFGGLSLLRVAALPTSLLGFAIPVPNFVNAMLSWKLQLLSSELGVFFLHLARIPVYLEGNVIDLGVFKLHVVEACSGLRYLYPFLSLGFLAAYLFNAPFWQRCLVVVSTIPIAIAMNSARIAIIGIATHLWAPNVAQAFQHFLEGWVIFLICAILLWLEIWALARFSGRHFFVAWGERPPITFATALTALIAVMLAIPIVSMLESRQELVPARESFASCPNCLPSFPGNVNVQADQGAPC